MLDVVLRVVCESIRFFCFRIGEEGVSVNSLFREGDWMFSEFRV